MFSEPKKGYLVAQSLDPNTIQLKDHKCFLFIPKFMPDSAFFVLSRSTSPSVYYFHKNYIIFPHSTFSSLKGKDRPDEPLSSTNPTTTTTQEEEYEAGRIICQVCGIGIAVRDEATHEFTMKHWDAHRLAWYLSFIPSTLSSSLITIY